MTEESETMRDAILGEQCFHISMKENDLLPVNIRRNRLQHAQEGILNVLHYFEHVHHT